MTVIATGFDRRVPAPRRQIADDVARGGGRTSDGASVESPDDARGAPLGGAPLGGVPLPTPLAPLAPSGGAGASFRAHSVDLSSKNMDIPAFLRRK